MPKFIFHMGVNCRAYGDVEAEAATIEAAVTLLTADFVGENIAPSEITWDGLTGMTIIDVSDEMGGHVESEFEQSDIPSEYDPAPDMSAPGGEPDPSQSEFVLTIRQWDRTAKSDPDWHHKEFERIAGMIAEGYTSGEIVGHDEEPGWWDLTEKREG